MLYLRIHYMKLYEYESYAEYKEIQIIGNKLKLNKSFVKEESIEGLSHYLKKNIKNISFGLCHGTRQGFEQKWFKEFLGCNVVGTEISDTAKQFPNTIQWDFHELKDEWLNNVDFIYSNSLDHSYNPELCINNWIKCLKKKTGLCIIEFGRTHKEKYVTERDPFGATVYELVDLINKWGNNTYKVVEILDTFTPEDNRETKFIVVKRYL